MVAFGITTPPQHGTRIGDVSVVIGEDFVCEVRIQRPPHNFFDVTLLQNIGDALDLADQDASCRVVLLSAEGKNFCAGARIDAEEGTAVSVDEATTFYEQARRLFACDTPIVAAVQGSAIGGGLGLACAADFRVATPGSRFSSNFARLGFHHGFALTVTLPLIVGHQRALDLLYTGRRVAGEEAVEIGLCDLLVADDELHPRARRLAADFATSAPLAVAAIRRTMRGDLATQVASAVRREAAEQSRLRSTADFAEGIRASEERRVPVFTGR